MSNVIELDSWKGKSGLDITRDHSRAIDEYLLVSYRKDKDSGEVSRVENRVPVSMVRAIQRIIQRAVPVGKTLSYRQLIEAIKKDFGLSVPIDAWNGGSNRAKYYFPIYYWPVKVLEYEGVVRYGGRGNVTRLV